MPLIDWITVAAQIVNFLILVALLKYLLYGRILSAIDKREQEIARRWKEAERDRALTATELEAARDKNRELDAERDKLLGVVREEVEQYRQELSATVRGEVEQQQVRWAEALQEESAAFLRDLSKRASQEVCTIARRALLDLAGTELEHCIVNYFLARLRQLDADARAEMTASLSGGNNAMLVQTAFVLSAEQQHAIAGTLHEQFGPTAEIRFEQSADLICGIALLTDAHKLAWTLRDYLSDLEQDVQQTLDEEIATNRSRRTAPTSAISS